MQKSLLLSIAWFCFVAVTTAQEIGTTRPDLQSLQSLLQKPETTALPSSVAIEQAVDPEKYILGPGDVLHIVISGTSELSLQLRVSPEGSLQVPSVGSVDVRDLSLAEAKTKLMQKIRTKYLSNELTITLAQLRSFRVTVSGAVFKPGIVTVSALNRVSEAIELCGGFLKPINVRSESKQVRVETPQREDISVQTSEIHESAALKTQSASMRNILVHRRVKQMLRADILKYQLTGELEANPYLLDGDVIFVPTLEQAVRQVSISGAVKAPNQFEYAEGDRVRDILELAHGFSTDADSSQIELARFAENAKDVQRTVFHLDWKDADQLKEALDTPLKPDDRLFVRSKPEFHKKQNVEVIGEVMYPGIYAIEGDNVNLSEIIARAGGFTMAASLQNAYVLRRAYEDIRDLEFERLQKMTIPEMTEQERDYFKVKSRERTGRMGVDFVALFVGHDKRQDVLLRDRDLVVVPPQEKTVKIAGQVVNPGVFPYEPGRTMGYYVQRAGGFNWNVRKSKIRVIKARTGEWMKPDRNTIIEVGDTIFVPEKPERDYWTLARDLITVTAQLATIYLVVERAASAK